MNILKKTRVLAGFLMALGLLVYLPLGYYWLHGRLAVAQAPVTVVKPVVLPPKPTLVTGKPVSISIPSLNIQLSVIDGAYNQKTGEWTLTEDKAQFALPSVQPNNETGNTLIYGHYVPAVFAYLHHIQPGAQALVTTDNGYTFTYTYQSSEAFDPTDTSIFTYQGAPRLTIQTCSGSFMQHRQMYYFTFDTYTKSS